MVFASYVTGVVKGIAELPSDTVIDGENVALDAEGKPSFNLLQGLGGEMSAIELYTFDLLILPGIDVRDWKLENRLGAVCAETLSRSLHAPLWDPEFLAVESDHAI
jgi:ATP-dependent DNA ligase